ncbi:MAG: peptide chain release factor 1 [Cyanobacteria bacterium J06627_28]
MSSFRPLKYLPWTDLLQSAAVSVAILKVLDFLILQGLLLVLTEDAVSVPEPRWLFSILGLLIPFAIDMGVGAFSVFITARFFRQILLRAGTLWALVGCVLLLLFVASLLPLPGIFIGGVDYPTIMGVVVGTFLYGRRYW